MPARVHTPLGRAWVWGACWVCVLVVGVWVSVGTQGVYLRGYLRDRRVMRLPDPVRVSGFWEPNALYAST